MLLAAQEIHDVDILEAENDIMHNRVTDKNQHVNHRGQRKEQADVFMPEERLHPVQNDSPFPRSMIAILAPGSKRKKLIKEEKSKVVCKKTRFTTHTR